MEPGSQATSDQIRFTRDDNNLVITFISDPARFLTGNPSLGSAVETGQAQTILSFPGSETLRALTVTASSDVDAVPEPATWALMLVGFFGVGVAMRRRREQGLLQVA